MGMSEKVLGKVYMGVIGAVTTIAAQKILTMAWRAATGDDPPSPTDPETPIGQAVTWALASGVGIGVTQLLTTRLAARHFPNAVGSTAPDAPRMRFKI